MEVPAAIKSALDMARRMLQGVRGAGNPDEVLAGVMQVMDGTLTAVETAVTHYAQNQVPAPAPGPAPRKFCLRVMKV